MMRMKNPNAETCEQSSTVQKLHSLINCHGGVKEELASRYPQESPLAVRTLSFVHGFEGGTVYNRTFL